MGGVLGGCVFGIWLNEVGLRGLKRVSERVVYVGDLV